MIPNMTLMYKTTTEVIRLESRGQQACHDTSHKTNCENKYLFSSNKLSALKIAVKPKVFSTGK